MNNNWSSFVVEDESVNYKKYWCFHKHCPRHKMPMTIEECHEHLKVAHPDDWFLTNKTVKKNKKKKKKR